ncbi:MAG: hypothetical protein RO469_09480 [Thermincola sp.]|jgi:hypothetical protein|nr:hypothetical protein [Thermincola sp.]MDT3701668.1 hypothetical protein [Thermincola sp.]
MPENVNQDKKILVACPVNSRDWIIPYYLRNLFNLDYDRTLIDIYWIVNNSSDKSLTLLQDFKQQYEREYRSIEIDVYNSKKKFTDERKFEIRKKYSYYWLAELRNKLLKKCLDLDADYLFSSDCDILLRSDILKRLISHNKHIISSLLYNGYLVAKSLDEACKYPNILRKVGNNRYEHIVNYRVKHPEKNPIGTTIPCDLTGACILISKEVCSKAKYGWHIQGEDEYFCRSAKEAGYDIWCDISMYSQHVMLPELLDKFRDFK